MKTLYTAITFFTLALSLNAKMASTVEITNIQKIKIEKDKITIVGDGVFRSRIITTKNKKDSNFVISGKPTAEYTAKGYSTRFIIIPYTLNIKGDIPEKNKEAVNKLIEKYKTTWLKNLAKAKLLKKGGKLKLVIQGENVKFSKGWLVKVEGSGSVIETK